MKPYRRLKNLGKIKSDRKITQLCQTRSSSVWYVMPYARNLLEWIFYFLKNVSLQKDLKKKKGLKF